MAEVKKARLFLRRGTDTDRKTTTLCQGELGYSTDAFRVFIGDGSTAGGKAVGNHIYVSAGAHFHTDLTEASGSGRAHKGDIAVFPGQNYTNAAGTTVTPSKSASTVMILTADITATGSEAATPGSWVALNSGIPFGNIDVFNDDISGDKVHGGTISGPLTLSGGKINIGGNGPSENLVLSGTYLSAATLPTNDLVFPLGLTSGAQLTCVNSILDFGDTVTTSTLGNAGGYVHANPDSVTKHISAYGVGTTNYVFSTTATQQASGTPAVHNNTADGINIFTDYIKSGGAYATGSSTPLIPDNWEYTVTNVSGKCGILEVAFDQTAFRNATDTAVSFTAIREFYFSVFMKHHDDAASFVGHHNHCTDTNEILCWSGSSISDGKMRQVPAVHHITIPNTYNGSDNSSQHALVLHLGMAAVGELAVVFTGLRVNTS